MPHRQQRIEPVWPVWQHRAFSPAPRIGRGARSADQARASKVRASQAPATGAASRINMIAAQRMGAGNGVAGSRACSHHVAAATPATSGSAIADMAGFHIPPTSENSVSRAGLERAN